MPTVCVLLVAAMLGFGAQDTMTEPETQTTFKKTYGENPTLKLVGVAPRIKNILGVYGAKVYGAGLYVDWDAMLLVLDDREMSKGMAAAALRAMSGKRVLILKFVRDLEKDVMANAFKEAIEMTMPITDERIADDAKKLLGAFVPIKNGDEAVIHFEGTEMTWYGNGEKLVTVDNKLLMRAVLNAYLGFNPIDKRLKEGLLSGIK